MTDPETRWASPAEVIELLSTNRFTDLVGVVESVELDFKAFYDLDGARGRRDLVADVASFANTSGGLLVVGAKAVKHPVQQTEFCVEIRGVRAEMVTAERIQALLRQHTFPPVHVDVRPYRGHGSRGIDVVLVAIAVRAATDADRPVLVDRLVSDDEESAAGAVGWPARHGDTTFWEPGSSIQRLVSIGRQPVWQPPPAVLDPGTGRSLDEDLDALAGWDEWGRLVIKATPLDGGSIDDFYGAFRTEASGWRGIREMGFNLGIWPYVQFVPRRGDLVCDTSKTFVSVSSHGAVVAAGIASPEFLGWAQHQNEAPSEITVLRINPYPLVEFSVEAIRFAYELVGPAARVTRWRVVARLEQLDRVPVTLGSLSLLFGLPLSAATSDDDVEARIDSSGDWSADTFRLLEDMLGQAFGIGRDDIPLAADGRIDPATWRR